MEAVFLKWQRSSKAKQKPIVKGHNTYKQHYTSFIVLKLVFVYFQKAIEISNVNTSERANRNTKMTRALMTLLLKEQSSIQ